MRDDTTVLLETAAEAVGTPFARRFADVVRLGEASREALESATAELGLTGEGRLEAGVDILVETVRRGVLDHTFGPEEVAAACSVRRLCAIEDGDVLRFRRDEVADLVREAMERILGDELVTSREASFKVDLQEAFGLSYDQFLDLAREQHDAALRALLERISPGGRALTDEQFREFHLRAAHLDSVFNVGLLDDGDVGSSPGRYIPADVKNAVWRRDQGRCAHCGSAERLEFDHIVPHSRGGSNSYRNVQLLCERCNRSKGAGLSAVP